MTQPDPSPPPPSKPIVLLHESRESYTPIPARPKWVYAIVVVYLLLLLVLICFPLLERWTDNGNAGDMMVLGTSVAVLL